MTDTSLSGRVFGSLTVFSRDGDKATRRWLCRCSCGETVSCAETNLARKLGASSVVCQCARRRSSAVKATRHGKAFTREYRTWNNMLSRCNNPNVPAFAEYGRRGIVVEWGSFSQFFADMGPMPSPTHTIERSDVNGPYAAWNCRWATQAEQALNKRNHHILTFNGKSAPMAVWATEFGLPFSMLHDRINKLGWPIDKAITTPPRKQKNSKLIS